MNKAKCVSAIVLGAALIGISACQTVMNVMPGTRALPGGSIADLQLTNGDGARGSFAVALGGASREEKVGLAIAQSNKLCAEYVTTVSATERGLNTSLGVFSTLAHLGGVLADGTGAKAAWSAYGIAADGIQGNVRKGIFKDNEPTLLMAAIQTYRKQEYELLAKKISEGGVYQDLSFELLVPLIEEYHASCTISNAIIQIQKSVSQPTEPKPVDPQPVAPQPEEPQPEEP